MATVVILSDRVATVRPERKFRAGATLGEVVILPCVRREPLVRPAAFEQTRQDIPAQRQA